MQRIHKIIAYYFIILCLYSSLTHPAHPGVNDVVPDRTLKTNEMKFL